MTTNTPLDAATKPAANVISLDSRRDPFEVALRESNALVEWLRSRVAAHATPIEPEAWQPTPEQQAQIDANTARLRDSSTWIVHLRATFSPIAAALGTMASAAAAVEATLQTGETPSLEQLGAAVRVASAILNGDDMDGRKLEHFANEALQYASLLNGDYVIDEVGDVVDAKREVAS